MPATTFPSRIGNADLRGFSSERIGVLALSVGDVVYVGQPGRLVDQVVTVVHGRGGTTVTWATQPEPVTYSRLTKVTVFNDTDAVLAWAGTPAPDADTTADVVELPRYDDVELDEDTPAEFAPAVEASPEVQAHADRIQVELEAAMAKQAERDAKRAKLQAVKDAAAAAKAERKATRQADREPRAIKVDPNLAVAAFTHRQSGLSYPQVADMLGFPTAKAARTAAKVGAAICGEQLTVAHRTDAGRARLAAYTDRMATRFAGQGHDEPDAD
jgi:hypothetical protein